MADQNNKSVTVWCPHVDANLSTLMSGLTICCLLHDKLTVAYLHRWMGNRHNLLELLNPTKSPQARKEMDVFYKTLRVLEQEHVVEFLRPLTDRMLAQIQPTPNAILEALVEKTGAESARLDELVTQYRAYGKDHDGMYDDITSETLSNAPLEFRASFVKGVLLKVEVFGQLLRHTYAQMVLTSYLHSQAHAFPMTVSNTVLPQSTAQPADVLTELLAQAAIAQLVLPNITVIAADDLLDVRTKLRDELLSFQEGILNLSWLLHEQVRNSGDLKMLRREADMLVNTKIKAAVLSLEHRMQQHENKRIRRMLFGTGRVLVDAAKMFLPGGIQEKLVAGGKALLQTATEIDSAKPPEDQVATYLYKLKRHLKS
jgi:hypothetical protein